MRNISFLEATIKKINRNKKDFSKKKNFLSFLILVSLEMFASILILLDFLNPFKKIKKSTIISKNIKARKTLAFSLALILIISVSKFTFNYFSPSYEISLRDQALATDNSWDFDNSSNYEFDSSKISVSAGESKLTSDFFDDNWKYRQELSLNNGSNPNNLTGYQVRININNSNSSFWANIKNDGSDIRFTDSDKTTLLDYWIQDFNYGSQTSIIYVKVPSIPGASSKNIYLYYGNSGASSLSNASNTLEFYDDFSTNTLSDYTQLVFATHSGNPSPDWSIALQEMTVGPSNACQAIYHTGFNISQGVYIETYETGTQDNDGVGIYTRSSGGIEKVAFLSDEHQSPGGYKQHASGDSFTMLAAASDGGTQHPTPHKIALSFDQNGLVRMLKDENEVVSGYNDSGYIPQKMGLVSLANDPAAHYSYLFVKKYSYPEPSISTSSQESIYSSASPTIIPVSGSGISYTKINGFSETLGINNAGNISYQISNNRTNWYWWDGSTWSIASGVGQSNQASDINSNISQFTNQVGSGDFYFKAFLTSNGTQKTSLDSISLSFEDNNSPQVDAGSNKNVKDNQKLKPFADATIGDTDGIVEKAYYSIEGSQNIEITEGSYPSLEEATHSFEYQFNNSGEVVATLIIEDDQGATSSDTTVIDVQKYKITWEIKDESSNQLNSLTVSDSSGWSESNLSSPTTHYYDFGTYTTTWYRNEFNSYQEASWDTNEDKTITVTLSRFSSQAPINTNIGLPSSYLPFVNFLFDNKKNQFEASCWLQKNGEVIKDSNKCILEILKDGKVIKTLESTEIDEDGKFTFVWEDTSLDPDTTYDVRIKAYKDNKEYLGQTLYSFSTSYKDTIETQEPNLKIISLSQIDKKRKDITIVGSIKTNALILLKDSSSNLLASTSSDNNFWDLALSDIEKILGFGEHTLTIEALNAEGNLIDSTTFNLSISGNKYLKFIKNNLGWINFFYWIFLVIILGIIILNTWKRIATIEDLERKQLKKLYSKKYK